jgi:hypothetical protein
VVWRKSNLRAMSPVLMALSFRCVVSLGVWPSFMPGALAGAPPSLLATAPPAREMGAARNRIFHCRSADRR